MYKTIWNYVSKHSKKSSTASVFLPVLVLGWTAIGLQNAAVLVKTTVILCSGGYAGLIFGFFGGIFYIYRGVINPHTAVDL